MTPTSEHTPILTEKEITFLASIPEGKYKVGSWWKFWHQRNGWITLWRESTGKLTMLWTTGKNWHDPFARPATAVTLDQHGRLVACYESAIRMHMLWGYGNGSEVDRFRGVNEARWMVGVLKAIKEAGG